MIKTARTLIALISAFLLLGVAAPVIASEADELLRSAEAAVRKAEASRDTATINENYELAVKRYNEVIKTKKYANTLQAVKAQYGLARVYQTAEKGEFAKKRRQAYDGYRMLVNRYDRPTEVLEQTFDQAEVPQVRELAASALRQKTQLAVDLDKENSHKLLYKILDFLVALTGRVPWFSYWFAIILVTVIVKLAITPLTKAQFRAMKEMQQVAPLVKELQEKYKGDQKTIGEKTMELYKQHNINPFASCLPILVQMPVLWLLYYMIRSYEFQFAKATFAWIGSGLSHLYGVTAPFGGNERIWLTARNLAEPDLILVLLYVVSMYISTKLSAVDPTQADQQKMMAIVMPVMFAFIFASFPAAFLLYWLVYNILQTAQQYHIMHGGTPATAAVATPEISKDPAPPAEPAPGKGSSDRPRPRRKRR